MDFAAARRNMVDSQLRTNRITDEGLLAAMGELPRERFVPAERQPFAYADEDLGIAPGRYLLEPLALARMIQQAEVEPSDVVLDIGSTTGYAAIILARLAGTVFALESDAALVAEAGDHYAELAPDNVVAVSGPLAEGCAEHAPFDVIIIEGAVDGVPDAILAQLGDGGRLVATVVENGVGRVIVTTRSGDHYSHRTVSDSNLPRLSEFERPASFSL
jgi:protein-L-isoaspartate(D-aspartate) O-methyltransferase